ncbi:carboxylesterase/lipase family protein [Treponema pectinovorum]|uniref:carboxylesterase/lipase family protein n=1 Tax=Treponema pectinovorum TaxID=164 RepID=UPI003D8AB8BA
MKNKILKTLFIAFAAGALFMGCASAKKSDTKNPIANTKNGKLRGSITQSGIYSFKGVPYAQVDERFVLAHQVEKWDGIRDATEYGKISTQMGFMSNKMVSEDISGNDCQNLNIWTPAFDGKKRAVMVWLHGGGFSSGSAQEITAYDGENLSRSGDVVVVSVNHRLNILGYFDLSAYGEKYRYSGNAGTQDIVDALNWIQKNIASFGGDPKNVTLFGESGGGAKILALMTSPRAKGIFHKAIIESGATDTMGVVFTKQDIARHVTEETLKALGISKNNIEEIQQVPLARLLQEGENALAKTTKDLGIEGAMGPGTPLMWEPVVDGDFMPVNPVSKNGFAENAKGIPLLIGSNLNEWTSIPLLSKIDVEKTRLKSLSETEILNEASKLYGDKAGDVLLEYKRAYPTFPLYNALFIDTMIRLPMLKITAAKADQNAGEVYSYIFTYGTPFSYHGFEIPYVFNNVEKTVMGATSQNSETDKKMAELMSGIWVNFAKTANPQTSLIGNWTSYTRKNGNVMLLAEKSEQVSHHDEALLKLLAPEYEW